MPFRNHRRAAGRPRVALHAAIAVGTVLFVCASWAGARESELRIDGLADEAVWKDAQTFADFVQTQPLTLGPPRYATHVRMLSLPEGLAVAFEVEQPADEPAHRARRARDASPMASDLVYVMVDFDGTGSRAYEFTVSRGGVQRDGTISNESAFSYDWDARWQSAVAETASGWSAELLIPWSAVPMRESGAQTRRVGIHFGRFLESRGERYAWPGISFEQPRYVSAFARVDIPNHAVASFELFPYGSTRYDLVGDHAAARAGADLLWRPSSRFQLTAALKPDFGQVESDNLVVNFDAIETFFTDKRPFFTENNALFDLRTPRDDYLLYTRRIGGASDDGTGEAADIDAAVKFGGSAAGIDYGAFVASEEGEAGRDFHVVRALRPGEHLSVGYMALHTDRPALDRDAWVHAVDWAWRPNARNTVNGIVLHSRVDESGTDKSGSGGFARWLYAPNERWKQDITVTHYDNDLDFNDAGYMRRNSVNQVFYQTSLRNAGQPAASRNVAVTWDLVGSYITNDHGDRLTPFYWFARTAERQGGGKHYSQVLVNASGYDDRISRGNGIVRRKQRTELWHYYQSPRIGNWKFLLGGWWMQEGDNDHAFQLESEANYQFNDRLDTGLVLYPRWSKDWLIWRGGDQLASYRRTQIYLTWNLNWFPAPKHEFRLKTQWVVIDAHDATSFAIGPGGNLLPSSQVNPDFSVRSFGLQMRYRHEIGPQRELYVVYARGGYLEDEDHTESSLRLLDEALRLRDSDQVLIKLRWRL